MNCCTCPATWWPTTVLSHYLYNKCKISARASAFIYSAKEEISYYKPDQVLQDMAMVPCRALVLSVVLLVFFISVETARGKLNCEVFSFVDIFV